MFGFFGKKGFRDQQRKIGIYVPGFFKPAVQPGLHGFPNGVAIRPDDHAALDGGVVGQFPCLDNVLIPLGKVFMPGGDVFCHDLQLLGFGLVSTRVRTCPSLKRKWTRSPGASPSALEMTLPAGFWAKLYPRCKTAKGLKLFRRPASNESRCCP